MSAARPKIVELSPEVRRALFALETLKATAGRRNAPRPRTYGIDHDAAQRLRREAGLIAAGLARRKDSRHDAA